jgi:small subunit ribosomal protein S1
MASMAPEDLAELCGEVGSSHGAIPTDAETVPPGKELTGTVVGFSDDEVFLEFDAKSQGVLARGQLGESNSVELGVRLEVVVDRFDSDSGMLVVRRKGAVQRAAWTNLAVGMIVQGKITGLNKGGLEVDFNGIRGFMPGSQVDLHPMRDISVLLGQVVRCEVIELERKHKNVLVSRRKLLERERAEFREKLKEELAVGQSRRGVVNNITEYGAFVDLGGLDGLIHIRDVSWSPVEKVSDVLTPGQEVEVKVLRIDAKRERISLGLKQAQPDPWQSVPGRYAVGTDVKVRVVRLADFGAFAELEPGIEGLIPVSEMAWHRVQKSSDLVSIGSVVDAKIIRIEPERRRIALSIRQAQPDPWAGVLESFPEKSVVRGKVTRLANFGAFVELASGVEGLIHISELSDRRVKTCRDVVDVGQEVDVRVLGIDRDNRRISLSLKTAAPTEGSSDGEPEAPKPVKKRKKPLRGGLSSHWEW